MPVLVDVARLEAALLLAAARRAHLVEIVGMDELDGAVADHLLRPIAHDRHRARADLHEGPDRIGDQNEVPRCLENALSFLDLPAELPLRPFAFGEVASDLRCADDLA